VPDQDELDAAPDGQQEAALAVAARHALHDEVLIAALAAGDLAGEDDAPERERARALVTRCPACRVVHDDVAAISAATRATAARTAVAPRDFRLTPEAAIRLGGTVPIGGRLVAPRAGRAIRALLAAFARPVGASVAAMGLVGVLVGSAAMGMAGVASAPAFDDGSAAGAAEASPRLGIEQVNPGVPAATKDAVAGPGAVPAERGALRPGAVPWLLLISAAAVVVGLVLFVAGVRAARGPTSGAGIP
jgi:hypothetical protein